MREKIIRGLISSIIVVLLLGFEYKLSFNIVHDFESRNTSYAIEDFYQINDYDVDGDKLVPTSADPQLILNFDGSIVDKVTVFLSEAPTDEIKGQLYFFEKKGFSEKNSIAPGYHIEPDTEAAPSNPSQRYAIYIAISPPSEYPPMYLFLYFESNISLKASIKRSPSPVFSIPFPMCFHGVI